jgi:pimeloyl-ACP methyl ester carboxylesterase
MIDRFENVNGITIHCLHRPGGEPPIVLLPGLSANAHSFDGLMAAGLSPQFQTLALDLRGRGDSEKPVSGYTLADHASDVLALMDRVGLQRPVVLGHSFGGLLTMYLAALHPDRVSRAILVDVALWVVDEAVKLVRVSLDRLTKTYPSADEYIAAIRSAPYVGGFWDPAIENYYRAEIETGPDGTARARTSAAAIATVIAAMRDEPWGEYASRITVPSLLINAPGPFGPPGAGAVVPADLARATAAAIPNCRYVEVPGNHLTMVFGGNAECVLREIREFIASEIPALA